MPIDGVTMTEMPDRNEGRKPGGLLRRLVPLALLAGLFLLFYLSGAVDYLSFESLRSNLDLLQQFVDRHAALSLLLFVGFYALGTALSLPAMSVVTVAAGVVFGLWVGFLGVLIGATIGASAIFLMVRTALADSLRRRVGPWLARFEQGFREDEFHYLLALRLVPVVPFWVLNIAPALLGMRLRNYVVATVLGIIPGSFVYVWIGRGAAVTIRLGGTVDLSDLLFRPHVIGPMIGLALLSILPVLVRKLRGRIG